MPFPSTNWTLLAEASLSGDVQRQEALDRLCRSYWKPVCAVVAARWPVPAEAEDVTQDFFVHVMRQRLFSKADRTRGRFRSFLLGALRYFISHRQEAEGTQRRGGRERHITLEEWIAEGEAASDPEFDRAWALELLGRALVHVESENPVQFRALRPFLPGAPASAPGYEAASAELNLPVGTLKAQVSRLRRQLREQIRREVARTVAKPHEVDEEFAYLLEVLRR